LPPISIWKEFFSFNQWFGVTTMTTNFKNAFSALPEQQQALVLAAFAFELTILARDGYESGTEELSDPQLVRRINEMQHRVSIAIVSRLKNDTGRYPDDVLMDIVVGSGADKLSAQLRSSFLRAWDTAIGTPLEGSSPK
jgi:hypothetical protein